MPLAAGPIKQMSFAGRAFLAKGQSAGTLRNGGFSTTRNSNGDQNTSTREMTPVPWVFEGQEISLDLSKDDFQYITDLNNSVDDFDVVITWRNGDTWGGLGNFDGEPPEYNAMTAGSSVTLKGDGEVKPL